MSKVKFIIVGASGFVGKHLNAKLYKNYDCIGTSTKLITGLVKFDLQNPLEFDFKLISHDTVIYFLASISSPDECNNNINYVKKINVIGTCAFIEKAISLGAKVIFFSSDIIYGHQKQEFKETAPVNPIGNYAEMKREVEEYFSGESNFKSLRLSYIFSRDDKFTNYLLECLHNNKEAVLFDPFDRSVIYREDVLEGAMALAFRWKEFPQQVLNFGGPQNISRVEYAKELIDSKILTELRYRIEEPDEGFFNSRPRQINMKSPFLHKLLNRKPRTLRQAAQIEFNDLYKKMEINEKI